MDFFQDKTFSEQKYTTTPLARGEYDNCRFIDCTFEGLHLSNYTFLECTFEQCNFTNVKFGSTTFHQVDFDNCKLLGANFSICNDFMIALRFRESVLNLATFSGLKLKATLFINCNLTETDFTDCDLSTANFSGSNLTRAIFEHTNLEKADFRKALHFSINPTVNKLRGARFSKDYLSGLVDFLNLDLR